MPPGLPTAASSGEALWRQRHASILQWQELSRTVGAAGAADAPAVATTIALPRSLPPLPATLPVPPVGLPPAATARLGVYDPFGEQRRLALRLQQRLRDGGDGGADGDGRMLAAARPPFSAAEAPRAAVGARHAASASPPARGPSALDDIL